MRETFGILIMCRKHKEVFMNQIDRFLVVLCLLPDIIFNKIKLITVPVVGYYLNTIILALLSIYLSSFIENITFAYLKYNSAYSVTVLLSISFFINCILQVLYTLYLRWRNYFIYSYRLTKNQITLIFVLVYILTIFVSVFILGIKDTEFDYFIKTHQYEKYSILLKKYYNVILYYLLAVLMFFSALTTHLKNNFMDNQNKQNNDN